MDETRPVDLPWNAPFKESYVYQVTWHRMDGNTEVASGAMMPLHRTLEGAEKDLAYARSLITHQPDATRLYWSIEERPIDL